MTWTQAAEDADTLTLLETQRDDLDSQLQRARGVQHEYRVRGLPSAYLDQRIRDLEAQYNRVDDAVVREGAS